MAYGCRPADRDQQFLLPPDMRTWLPEGHLAWLVDAKVVAVNSTKVLRQRVRVGEPDP